MSEPVGTWTEVPAAEPQAEIGTARSDFAALGTASWLPPRVQRAQMAEAQAEAREARRQAREREAQREKAAESALVAYRAAAEQRGEYLSVLDVATGNVPGRTVADVFRSALEASEHEDARAETAARRREGSEEWIGADEPRIGRSDGWPSSAYQADRLIARAEQLHRDRIAFMARHNYPAAMEAARAQAAR